MWTYDKKLEFPVKIKNPDARAAKIIISQLGGPDGEIGAAMRYLNQRYSMPYDKVVGILTDVGTEELAHIEMIAAILYQLTRNLTPEQIKAAGFETYFVDHTTGIYPQSAAGVPFSAATLQCTGDVITDLMEDLAAVNAQWRLIENEITALHRGEGSAQRLLELSETHFALADAMVLSAQKRAEHDLLATGAICTILFLSAATIMLFMRNDRISKLKKAYFTHPLTKHGNMLAFEEQGQQLLSDAAGGTYLVAYTNVLNFGYINETYCYESGDRLIVTLARLLDSACRRNELAAHDNADHFVLLLHNEPQRIERLLGHVEAELRSTPELHFTGVLALGCGVCEAENPGNSIPLLVSNAIAVMKEIPGKKGIARYDQSFRNALELKNRIERHADQALAMREFRLYLQPKNLLGDGTLAGAEALARWESPSWTSTCSSACAKATR